MLVLIRGSLLYYVISQVTLTFQKSKVSGVANIKENFGEQLNAR